MKSKSGRFARPWKGGLSDVNHYATFSRREKQQTPGHNTDQSILRSVQLFNPKQERDEAPEDKAGGSVRKTSGLGKNFKMLR